MTASLLRQLAELEPYQNANDLWQRFIRKSRLARGSAPLQHPSNRDHPDVVAAYGLSDEIAKLSRRYDEIRESSNLAAAVYWAQRAGILDELIAFLDERRIQLSTANIRWWNYARCAAAFIEPGATVMEIGGGNGELAYFLHARKPWSRYVAIDLPPMLEITYNALSERVPGASFVLNEWPERSETPQVVLLDPGHAESVPDDTADIALNFNSFMEMDEQVRDGYIALIYRAVRPGGVFYNSNRRNAECNQLDGTVYDNHPLRYPYRKDDLVLEWTLDHSQQDVRNPVCGSYKNLPMSRIAIVRPDQGQPGDRP